MFHMHRAWQDRQAGRQAARQAGRQGGRQADRQGGRQGGRQAGTQAGRQQGGRQAGREVRRQTGRQGGVQAPTYKPVLHMLSLPPHVPTSQCCPCCVSLLWNVLHHSLAGAESGRATSKQPTYWQQAGRKAGHGNYTSAHILAADRQEGRAWQLRISPHEVRHA